jgi:Gpi18-like mannosyltransferase
MKKIKKFLDSNPVVYVIGLFIIWRIVIQFIAWFADIRFDDANYGYLTSVPGNRILSIWAKWDSVYYHDFIANGYKDSPFFPGFIWISQIVKYFIGGYHLLSAAIVANVFALGSCIMLYKIARLEGNDNFAQRAVFYMLIFPSSFFLVAHYTESLFLFLILTSFYFALNSKWVKSGIFGFMSCFTRTTGILIFPALLAEIVLEKWGKFRKNIHWKNIIAICLIPLGMLLFVAYNHFAFNEPIGFMKSQPAFGRTFTPNLLKPVYEQSIVNFRPSKFFSEDMTNAVNYFFSWLIFLIFVVLLFKYSRPSYAVLGFLFFIIPASSGTLISMNRFLLVLFPIYLLVAKLIKPNSFADRIYTYTSLSVMILLCILFTNGHWVG